VAFYDYDTQKVGHAPSLPIRGRIATGATTSRGLVTVVVPAFSETLEWGPMPWGPEREGMLPARGDECLMMMDNTRRPWVLNWWPRDESVQPAGSLDGPVGEVATAELDGSGRIGIVNELTWELLNANGVQVSIPTGSGIYVLASASDSVDKYAVQFERPGPAGVYLIRWRYQDLVADEFFVTT